MSADRKPVGLGRFRPVSRMPASRTAKIASAFAPHLLEGERVRIALYAVVGTRKSRWFWEGSPLHRRKEALAGRHVTIVATTHRIIVAPNRCGWRWAIDGPRANFDVGTVPVSYDSASNILAIDGVDYWPRLLAQEARDFTDYCNGTQL